MAGTNPDIAVDDSKVVTEDDLRSLKYPEDGVEPLQEEDEPAEGKELDVSEDAELDDQIIDEALEEEIQPKFVKEFDYIKGDTPEEYAKNLEIAYKNSSSEALRLKAERDTAKEAPSVAPIEKEESTVTTLNPTDLYVQQQLDREIQTAFSVIQKEYPQVNDPTEYAKFTQKVNTFSRTILDSEKRLASPEELYTMAAVSLKWERKVSEPDEKEKLAMAAKNGAAISKSTDSPTKPTGKTPKISEAQMKLNRQMYPGKTDQQIIEELTPYL